MQCNGYHQRNKCIFFSIAVAKIWVGYKNFKKYLLKNRRLRKFVKMFIMLKGMRSIKRAAEKPTYKTVWVAGPSIDNINEIKSVKDIIRSLTE